MKRKVLSVILSLAMAATLLIGCGNTQTVENVSEQSETETSEASETLETETPDLSEHVTIRWYLDGSSVVDDTEVMEKVNEYLNEKLNMTLEPIWGTWGDFDEGASVSLQTGDDIDIYFTCSWTSNEYSQFSKDGYYVRLDDPENNLLEKYAPDLFGYLPESLINGAYVEGMDGYGIYAVPGYKDIANQYGYDCNMDILKKYGFDESDVEKGFYEFGDMLATIKAGEGESFFPLMMDPPIMERAATQTAVIDNNSLLSYFYNVEDPSLGSDVYGEVFLNKATSEEFKKYTEKVREYYQLGYIDPNCGNKDTASQCRKDHYADGTYAISTMGYSYGYDKTVSKSRGIEVKFIPTMPPYMDTTSSRGAMMAISTASKNPERAMMFLNLLNTDSELMTMLNYGIEGIHYTKLDDGTISFTEKRSDYTPWTNGMGNVTILPPTDSQGADFVKEFKDYYGASYELPISGFTINYEPIETEYAACSSIVSEYLMALQAGTAPEGTLEEYIDKLNNAGIEKVVDECNRQLQEFLANKQ